MTPERQALHEIVIPEFKKYLTKGTLLYDCGKTEAYNYKEIFSEQTVLNMDRDKSKNPDILIDIETQYHNYSADNIMCMGVMEQCDNPFKIIEAVKHMLKKDGYALFGCVAIGYPPYEWDYIRFTPQGFKRTIERDFTIVYEHIAYRGEIPSYTYLICKHNG